MKQRFYFYFLKQRFSRHRTLGHGGPSSLRRDRRVPNSPRLPPWSLWLWSGVRWRGPRDAGGPPELKKQSCGPKGTTSQHLDFTGHSTREARDQERSPEAHRAERAGVCQNRPAWGPRPAARRVRGEHVCPLAAARGRRLGEAPP